MVLGILLALGSSVLTTFREVLQKDLTTDFSSLKLAFMGQVWGAILVSPVAVWHLSDLSGFTSSWTVLSLLISGFSVLITVYLLFEALREEDLSVVSPLKNVNPVIVAVFEPILLSTFFSPLQIIGAVLGTIGAYILVAKNGLRKPLENLRNREAQLTLLIAFVYAFSTIARKFGTGQVDAFTFSYLSWMLTLVGFTILALVKDQVPDKEEFFNREVFGLGVITVISVFMGFFAISMISATDYTVIKQTSGLFSVLMGGRIFREKDMLRKMIGAIFVIAGVVAVVI